MKEAWEKNIPYVIAEINFQKSQLSTTTPDGVYRAVLARTGDAARAETALKTATLNTVVQGLPKNG